MSEAHVAGKHPVVLDLEAGTYYWCACGRSAKQPFCDGAHKGSGISPLKFEVTEPCKKALCLCKQAAEGPFCDGAHKKLP